MATFCRKQRNSRSLHLKLRIPAEDLRSRSGKPQFKLPVSCCSSLASHVQHKFSQDSRTRGISQICVLRSDAVWLGPMVAMDLNRDDRVLGEKRMIRFWEQP
jgi:hypothetical protein